MDRGGPIRIGGPSTPLKSRSVAFLGSTAAGRAPDAEQHLWQQYADLSPEASALVHDLMLEEMTRPQGWTVQGIARRIEPVLLDAGLEPKMAKARARNIARTDSRALVSQHRLETLRAQDQERGVEGRYRRVEGRDHRVCKLCNWVLQQTPPGGLPMEQLERLMDEAVARGVRGEFAAGGALAGVRGEAIRLPMGFERRGVLLHFQDRGDIEKVS